MAARVGADLPGGVPRYEAMGVLAAREAVGQSGLSAAELATTSITTATAIGATCELERVYRDGTAPSADDLRFESLERGLRRELHAGGRGLVMSTGCTAGLDALGSAFRAVRSGRDDIAVVCASDATISPIVVAAFDKIGALTRRHGSPDTASRPFDAGRDGFALGEGAACVALESEESLVRRGGRAAFEIRGWASVSSALHMTALREDGSDIARALIAALRDAGASPSEIDVIDSHGTSTPLNDASESAAITTVCGEAAADVAITAQKGVNGHALGASNLLEIVGCGAMFQQAAAPPIANTTDPTVPLRLVLGSAEYRQMRTIVKLSSGFSGIHTAIVMSAA